MSDIHHSHSMMISVDKPLLLQFDPHPSNVRDMSFLPSALPADWTATALASGIARIVTVLRSGPA